jgi:hypothetical protein
MSDITKLSKEEMEEKKKSDKREYMKNYMKKRRETDIVFAEKQREITRKNLQNRYKNDTEYLQYKKTYDKNRYLKYKDAFELVKQMQNTTLNDI